MNLELAYQDYGEGPPLIILHGLFGSARNWRSIAQRLAKWYHVYVVELRNHGDSPWHDVMDYPAMAGDVHHFIKSHQLDAPTVVGHSMGGKAAMTLALSYPDGLHRLIVVDIAPVSYTEGVFVDYLDAMQQLDLSQMSSRTEVDSALQAVVPQAAIRGFLLQNLVANGPQQYRWRINLAALTANVATIAGFPDSLPMTVYQGQTEFIAGAASDYIQPQHHSNIERLFPNAEVHTVANAGHWVHAEQPQQIIDLITAHR